MNDQKSYILKLLLSITLCFLTADITSLIIELSIRSSPAPIIANNYPFNRETISALSHGLMNTLSNSRRKPSSSHNRKSPSPATPLKPKPSLSPKHLSKAENSPSTLPIFKGTLAGENVRLAVFESAGRTFFLKQGDKLNGYTIDRVDNYQITLRRGNKTTVLKLDTYQQKP